MPMLHVLVSLDQQGELATAAAAKEKEACEKKQKRSHPFFFTSFFQGKRTAPSETTQLWSEL
jgi:hypothetical protein